MLQRQYVRKQQRLESWYIMDYTIEVRVNQTFPNRGKASAHIVLGPENSLTISDISVWRENGKVNVSLPMSQFGGKKRPCITLQGNLKKDIHAVVAEQFLALCNRRAENDPANKE